MALISKIYNSTAMTLREVYEKPTEPKKPKFSWEKWKAKKRAPKFSKNRHSKP
jgi:hypothetical protein